MPERYFDVGIAEQHALLLAAGMALEGAKPVAAIYSTFLQRAYDQIVHDVCLQHLNVVLAMDRAGLVGDDGPTHHGAFDIAYLRALPNITLMAPRDEAMLVHMLHTALACDHGPVGLRYPRGEGDRRPRSPTSRSCWRSARARSCARARASRSSATAAASRRAWRRPSSWPTRGIEVTVADARFAKPLDARAARRPGRRARAARHGRGGRPRRRLRQRGVGDAGRRRGGRAAHPADRAARPLRHPRQAGPAARGGRLHRATHRRAHRGRGGRSALRPRRALDAPPVHGRARGPRPRRAGARSG